MPAIEFVGRFALVEEVQVTKSVDDDTFTFEPFIALGDTV